jgi:hypothetical protein
VPLRAASDAVMAYRPLTLVLLAALAGCGRVGDLEPAAGKSLPVRPLMARTTPDAEELLTPPPYASPDRVDELVKKSEPREADPFDLPPPVGGAAPPEPAGTDPEPEDDSTGPSDPGAIQR